MKKNIFEFMFFLVVLLITILRPQVIPELNGTLFANFLTSELFHLVVFLCSSLGLIKSALAIGKCHSDKEWANFTETQTVQDISKKLGNPEKLKFNELERKIRTNLMFFSVLSLVMIKNGISINTEKPMFGLWLQGESLDDQFIFRAIFWVVVYLLVHFIWSSLDIISDWWIRLSGLYQRENNPYDIGGWWYNQIGTLEVLKNNAMTFQEKLDELKPDKQTTSQQIAKLRELASPSISHIDSIQAQLGSNPQILVALKRFSSLSTFLLVSQNLRWLLIELMAPILVGIYTLFSLYGRIWVT